MKKPLRIPGTNKLIFQCTFSAAVAQFVIGFPFASVLLFFLGIIGEYIGAIYTKVLNDSL